MWQVPKQTAVCQHCQQPLVRFPTDERKRWLHDPKRGFRSHRCRGADTVATPLPGTVTLGLTGTE